MAEKMIFPITQQDLMEAPGDSHWQRGYICDHTDPYFPGNNFSQQK